MSGLTRGLLIGTLAAAVATSLPAQRGGARGAPPISSTAMGAGALMLGPSATARSAMAARGSVSRYIATGSRGFYTGGSYGRDYRRDRRSYPYAYFLAPYYYPSLDYDASYEPGYDEPPEDPNAQAAAMAQEAFGEQLQRLTAAVEQLQQAQQPPAPAYAQQPAPPPPPVTLVLRNGQQLQVQNYAVMNQTFWDLSNQAPRKIPLTAIDVAASQKATEANGGEFPTITATP